MTFRRASLLALLFAGLANAQGSAKVPAPSPPSDTVLQGTVTDARDGHPLFGAALILTSPDKSIRSDSLGHFELRPLLSGDYHLEVTLSGYLPLTVEFHLDAGERRILEVSLQPKIPVKIEAVNVFGSATADPRDEVPVDRVSLTGDDLKNLSTVLADDPLRALHGLPGVASNDDFGAQFTLRGADFSRIGIYLDGIKLHNALHSLEGTDLSGSASTFNTALVGELDLYKSAYPERFADSSAGALAVSLRDGTDRYHVSISANLGTAGVTASGPLGDLNRCSWIGGYRKSFLQYVLARTLTDPSLAFGIEDAQGRVTCHADQHNTFSLEIIDSHTNLDRSSVKNTLGADSLMLVNQHVFTTNLSWIYSPTDRLQIASHAAWMPDAFDAKNPVLEPLGSGVYSEKAWNTNATWVESSHASSSIGFSFRAMGENGFKENYNSVRAVRLYDIYRGAGILSGGYFAESWTGLHDYVHLNVSGQWDHNSVDGITAFSPQGGASLRLLPSLTLQLGWGQYVQFPELSVFGSNLGSRKLLPLRSNQAIAAVEQRLPWNARVKVEYYYRADRDLLYQPTADPRLLNGQVFLPSISPAYTNSLHGNSRGVEVYLQRTSTSGVGGWISYAYGKTSMIDGVSHDSFPSDWDQRHTLNVYGTYRLRPTINLSAKWTYGSGFPAPGYFQLEDGTYYLSDRRNQLQIGPYQRLDVRVNKVWHREKWKKSLYFEMMNLTNKTNYRFGSLDGYSPSTGLAFVTVDSMFPILPTIGFVLER